MNSLHECGGEQVSDVSAGSGTRVAHPRLMLVLCLRRRLLPSHRFLRQNFTCCILPPLLISVIYRVKLLLSKSRVPGSPLSSLTVSHSDQQLRSLPLILHLDSRSPRVVEYFALMNLLHPRQ